MIQLNRKIAKKKDYSPAVSVWEVQILGPHYVEELDIDFTNQEVKNIYYSL
jgi:hypothetical protein